MPVRIVVGVDPEIRAAHHLKVVRQAGMRDSKVVRRHVCRLGKTIDVRVIRIANQLFVPVILHHDHKHVIQAGNAFRHATLFCGSSARKQGQGKSGSRKLFQHREITFVCSNIRPASRTPRGAGLHGTLVAANEHAVAAK